MTRTFGLLLAGVALSQLPFLGSCLSAAPTGSSLNGTFIGVHNSYYGVDTFLGIPYAQPPLSSLRYRAPQPSNSSWSGAKNATTFGDQCVGYGSDTETTDVPVSENCLVLNIVRPSGFENTSLPVGIWIHGGNYQQGSSADPRYNLTFMVQSSVEAGNPIIAIGINYRLHTWGFLFSQEIKDAKIGNLGLRDQRAAILWVNENIAGFGGDPNKVTIWGESSYVKALFGAGSVGAHLVAYNGSHGGLFRAAIAESGSPISWSRYAPISEHQSLYDNITIATGCSNATDTLDCLRYLPFETLNNVLNSSVTSDDLQYPVIDEDFILQDPTTQLLNGQFAKVPFLIGANFDEGASFTPTTINTDEEFVAYLESDGISSDNSTLAILQALYPDIPEIGIPATFHGRPGTDLGLQFKRAASVIGDILMHAPRRYTNQMWAAHNVTSYSYRFNVVPNGDSYSLGASHFKEVAFVMYNIDGVGYVQKGGADPFANKPDSYKDLAYMMTRMWSSFIYNLDPNDSGGM
ncbi:hypothetical protein BP5796_00770 [Coleophoma crateriformis]|uniref:Carboxylesterase type B domain-containing protein n=1 Tax=Coleophoma crateriformis TaxID=565419 RepID=A0A3D8T907_9HELO|nr:hypothetical protein BP5796_00770 [Coleophoma crateriformis]